MMEGITFAQPGWFWLLLLLPLMVFYEWRLRRRSLSPLVFPGLAPFAGRRRSLKEALRAAPFLCRLGAVGLLVVALARPQSSSRGESVTSEGIAIVLAMDISSSMLAEDLKPNRIEAAKRVALDFVDGRPNDLIGLVIFSGESFSQCPITSDHDVLKNLMGDIKSGLLEDGTAIGEGLATAIARLKDSEAKSKVIILLTDGVNNAGSIAPLTAGEIAKTFGIRVYTVGVGRSGMAPYPMKTPFGIQYTNVEVQIDEAVLQSISGATDARYFRATDNNKLRAIYREIDRLEKTKIEITEFHRRTEEYVPWLAAAGLLLAFELLLRYGYLRSLP
jgi:Ca-activated chloride channel family protein